MRLLITMDVQTRLVLVHRTQINSMFALESPDSGVDVLTLWDILLFPDLPMPPGSVILGFLYHGSLELGGIICLHRLVVVQSIWV